LALFYIFLFTTGHFCMCVIWTKTYYFPLYFLPRFLVTVSSFTGIYAKYVLTTAAPPGKRHH